jgi:DNA modification methylase
MAKPSKDDGDALFPERSAQAQGPVECLGLPFPNDQARRDYFLEKLRERLHDPDFRKIEGFPIGTDEDILAMSDPPYYTACPNPFLAEFIQCYGKPYDPNQPYSREPFAVDVSEGKTDPIYKAHSYHTKVPHLAIVPSILHYTEPGDLVLDGFCGSGMTGVAALWCGAAPETYRSGLEAAWQKDGMKKPRWGARRVVLNDLSPAATFIAANYNLPLDVRAFAAAGRRILANLADEMAWMYETRHTDGKTVGRIVYTVWSEVFHCPECSGEVVFVDEALDAETKRVRATFPCPKCGVALTKDNLERVLESRVDPALGKPWKRVKFRPSFLCYEVNGRRYEKAPDEDDLRKLEQIEKLPLPREIPTNRFPIEEMYHGSRIEPKGFTHIHHFFMPRSLSVLAAFFRATLSLDDRRTASNLKLVAQHQFQNASIMNRYRPASSFGNAPLGGVYYVPSQIAEANVLELIAGSMKRVDRMAKAGWTALGSLRSSVAISTHSSASGAWGLRANSIDYIFTDPPFGENIYYADLNFLVESWHRVLTDAAPEAIVDHFKKKGLPEYQHLMQRCFTEYCRVLKPGRWMTVVFHNSRNAVWNAIQEAMLAAGFVVADVRTLDKQQGSYRQVTSTAVKQDLVISAYKPNGGLEERFRLEAGTENGVWDFIRTHLRQLPIFVAKDGKAEAVAERQSYLLFDRMVAFHVQRGVTVPLSAAEFHAGLAQRFSERDGMSFLPEQVPEYDKKRMNVPDVRQLQIFVNDESSAIQWLNQQLIRKPQTFQELHPQFLKEIGGWQKHEKALELSELLEENFLRCDGKGEVPNQIHSYLSTNFKELRKLPKDDERLRAKGKDRWYVPDPNKAGDLEKLRDRSLLKEFWEYLPPGYKPIKSESQEVSLPGLEPKPEPVPKGKKMKVIRLEAVRAGFKHCWQNRDYRTIIAVAHRIPESALQEDPKLLMWYDQAVTRMGEE